MWRAVPCLVALLVVTARPGAGRAATAAARPGVPPPTPWSCPDDHPIKGYTTGDAGERVYFLPGGRFYEEASPERCYASEDEARRDGGRPARPPWPARPYQGPV